MINYIKKILLNEILKPIIKFRSNYLLKRKIKKVKINHEIALKKIRKKDKIRVAFFLIHESVWKYERLYELLLEDNRFEPVVVICPYTPYGKENMLREMKQAYNSILSKEYNVIRTLDVKNNKFIDVKQDIKPDIVFFTNPWMGLTKREYTILNYLDTLTCYVPYGFKNSYLYQAHFNQQTHNLVWKFFLETNIHKKLSQKYALNKSVNTVVTGFPGLDIFLDKNYKPTDVWKIKDRSVKRIIWAPHHTIPGYGATLDYSTFLDYCDFMLEMANKYKDRIQLAFKPHPVLRSKLTKPEVWGKEKTDAYYKAWDELVNGQLNEGSYVDLFVTSDAMIHDSSSFVIEYLYVKKPVMFLFNDKNNDQKFNEIGKKALQVVYKGNCKNDIVSFIEDVLLKDSDFKKEERDMFFEKVIKPPNNITASENIYNYLLDSIFNVN